MKKAIVLTVTAAIALSGCTSVDIATQGPGSSLVAPNSEPPPTTRNEPPQAAATPTPGGGGPEDPSEPSVFALNEDPPEDVAEFLEAIPGGGIAGPCDVSPPEDSPGIAMHETDIPTSLCGLGFNPGQVVAIVVRGPGGRESTAQVTADESGFFEWEFEQLPGRLQGEYFASATEGDNPPVERTFNVQFDTLKAAVIPRFFPRGGATVLGIAGGRPGQSVPVHLYRERAPDAGWDFIAELEPAVLNDNGQRRVELRSRRGDELGKYMVVVDPDGENIGYWFEMRRRNAAQ